jgi:Spy/CpxP family protein refolding chaperone
MSSRSLPWAFALMLGTLPLAAQAPGSPATDLPTATPSRAMARLAERLKLSEPQKAQVQAIWTRHAEGAKARRQALQEARSAFREALRDPDTPEARLRTLHQALEDRNFEQLLDRRSLRAEIRAVLSPEQRTEWDRAQAFRAGYRMGRQGRGR